MDNLAISDIFYHIKLDLEGNYTYVNQYFKNKFIHISTEFVGRHCNSTILKSDRKRCIVASNKCFQNPQKSVVLELKKQDKKGKIFWTRWQFTAIMKDNVPVGVDCIGYDITFPKKQQEKINRFTEKINQIIKVHSHEVRSPIARIIGLVNIIDKQELTKDVIDILAHLKKSALDLDKVVHKVVAISSKK